METDQQPEGGREGEVELQSKKQMIEPAKEELFLLVLSKLFSKRVIVFQRVSKEIVFFSIYTRVDKPPHGSDTIF